VEWSATNERPDDIPAKPADVYEGLGWVCLADWLGSHNYRKHGREFLSFGKAREFMRSLGLKSSREWMVWSASSAKPEDIPAAPHRIYKDKGWIGLNDWLGTYHIENQGRRFRSFESARLYAQGLKLSSRSEWSRWARSEKRPKDIPFHPQVAYEEDGWVSWRNWLGRHEEEAKRGPKPRFRPFQEAREFARALSLRTSAEWRRWAASGQRPRDIPSSPRRVYAGKGWQGMRDWLISDLVDRSETQPRVPVNDVQIREFVTTDQHDLTVTVDC